MALLLLLKKSLLVPIRRGGSSSSSTTISRCFIQSIGANFSSSSSRRVLRRRRTEEEERAMFEEWMIRAGKDYGSDDAKEVSFELFRETLRDVGYNPNRLGPFADYGPDGRRFFGYKLKSPGRLG